MPREEEHGAPVSEDDPTRAVSSIFVLIRDPTSDVTNQDVQDLFSQWGEVKEVRDGRGKTVMYVAIVQVSAIPARDAFSMRHNTMDTVFHFHFRDPDAPFNV